MKSLWYGRERPISAVSGAILLTRRALRAGLRRPWVLAHSIVGRGWSLTGADTFAIEKLVAEDAGAYTEMTPIARRAVSAALRASFSILLALACASLVEVNELLLRPDLCLAGAILLPAVLFNARTRFRFAALFCLAPGAGASVAAVVAGSAESRFTLVMVTLVLMVLFVWAPRRAERW